MAVNEQDIIQRLRAGQIAPGASDKYNLDEDRVGLISPEEGSSYTQPVETMGESFRAGLESGAANIAAQNKNFMATIATLRGNTEDAENLLREGDRLEEESGIPLAGMESFGEFLDEPTVGGFFNQVASATGQFVPSLAASLAEAAVVGTVVAGGTIATGGTATPALLAGAGTAIAKRQALKELPTNLVKRRPNVLKEDAEELLNKQYKNVLADKQGRPLPFPKLADDKKAQKDLADIYAQLRKQKLGSRFTKGALAGAYSQEQRMGTGIAFSDYADQGMRSPEDAVAALAQGQVFGAIGLGAEFATAKVIADRLKKSGTLKTRTVADNPLQSKLQSNTSFLKDLGTGIAVTSISEGIAEGLQEELSIRQKFRIDDDYTKANARVDRLNALFAGFFGGVGVGGALGTGTGVINKVREQSNYILAERDAAKMFLKRYEANKAGQVMKERQTALKGQFDFAARSDTNKDSAFIDIDSSSEADLNVLQQSLPNAIRVATPRGAYFTTDRRKAREFQNLVSVYPFNTELQDAWLAENGLGYSRTRKDGDDIVVGIMDNEINELVHYQSTSSTYENDYEKAKKKMEEIRGTADPARFEIVTQTLKEHADYRTAGLDNTQTTPFTSLQDLFQDMDEGSEMGTDQDDVGEADPTAKADAESSAKFTDVKRGRIPEAEGQGITEVLQDYYKLPINYQDLVFFVNFTQAATKGATTAKQITSTLKKAAPQVRERLAQILDDLSNAVDTVGQALDPADRKYLERVKASPIVEMSELLDSISRDVSNIDLKNELTSPAFRMTEEGSDITQIPLVGVTEILKGTTAVVDEGDQAATKQALDDVKVITKRGGSGTVENPYINVKTQKPWSIADKDDKKATPGQIAGVNEFVHPTLKEEFAGQQEFYSQKLIEAFIIKSKDEAERTGGAGYIRIVDNKNMPKLKAASKKGEVFVVPDYEGTITTKPDARKYKGKKLDPKYQKDMKTYSREFVLVRMQPEQEQFTQATGRNVAEARNIKEDLKTRVAQAKERTRGGAYKQPVYFKVKDLEAGLPEQDTGGKIDISVLLEGITTITKITRRRGSDELKSSYAQRIAAMLDAVVLLEEQGFRLDYYPDTVNGKAEPVSVTSKVRRKAKPAEQKTRSVGPLEQTQTVSVNVLLDSILSGVAGLQILKINFDVKKQDRLRKQLKELEDKFALQGEISNLFDKDDFAYVDTPFLDYQFLISRDKNATNDQNRQETAARRALIAPFLKDTEATSMSEATLNELIKIQESIDDFLNLSWPMPFEGEGPNYRNVLSGKRKNALEEKTRQDALRLQKEDGFIVKFNAVIADAIAAINKTDMLNNPGNLANAQTTGVFMGAPVARIKGKYEVTPAYSPVTPEGQVGREVPEKVRMTEAETRVNEKGETEFIYEGMGVEPTTRRMPQFIDAGGTIDPNAEIGTYIDDIRQMRQASGSSFIEDTGLYETDDVAFGNPVDNAATKIDKNDSIIFETYKEQEGKEYRGRDKYYEMSFPSRDKKTDRFNMQVAMEKFKFDKGLFVGPLQEFREDKTKNVKPKFGDNRKFKKGTEILLTEAARARRKKMFPNALEFSLENAPKQLPAPQQQVQQPAVQQAAPEPEAVQNELPGMTVKQPLPVKEQIIKGLTTAARQLGLNTNLKVLSAEETLTESGLSPAVQATLDMDFLETKRQELLNKDTALAMTLQYRHFDIILMKNDPNIKEGAYYAAYLKELGNSFTFQELEKSLKVPAVRKNLLEAFEKIKKSKNVPANYLDPKKGFLNFVADQYSLAIRDKLGLSVDGTTYNDLNKPAQSWFKRLANSQKKFYDSLGPAQRKRLEINESFQDYSDNIRESIQNPTMDSVPYEVKAKIETQIENILGPQTFTDKQIRRVLENADKLLTTKVLPKWLKNLLLTTDTRFRQMGPAGIAIADFFNLDPRTTSTSGRAGVITLKTRRANAMLNDVAKILGVKDGWFYSSFNEEQRDIINKAADDTIDTKDLPAKSAKVREYLSVIYEDLGLAKMGVLERKNFFPRIIAIAELAADPNKATALKALLKKYNPGESDQVINTVVSDLISKNNGDIEFTAKDDIELGVQYKRKPLFKNIPNIELMNQGLADAPEISLKKYLDKVSLRYEFEKSGGSRELGRLLNKLTEAQQEEARDMIDSMFGKIKPIQSGLLKKANDIGLTLNIVTLLGLTVIASLQDTAGPVLRSRGTAKISDVTKVIKDMIKNPQEAADIAREIGVIGVDAMSSFFVLAGEQDFMSQSMKNVSDGWFRVTGLEAYTRFTRVFATGMGTRFLQNHARKAQKGDSTSEAYLKELNITAEQVLAWEKGKADKATREKVNEALAQFVDESIVRPNPAQRPQYANDPRYALIWQLKSFFYAYGKTIVFPTLKESHRGFVNNGAGAGAMPIILMASMLLPITMLGLEIREFFKAFLAWVLPGISPNDPGVNYFKTDDMSTGQYMVEIIDRSGMLGPASLALPVFLESHRYGNPFWVPPLGPTAERVWDGVTLDWKPADFIPVYSQLDTRGLGR